MKARVIVHSTSGNTRLVTDYAAARLTRAGLPCEVQEIANHAERPEVDDVDVIGVAFPVMYFRPTVVIERIVDNLPAPKAGQPAFVLATAGGDPGAAMHLMVEQLERKGFRVIGAHWVVAPSNWPFQLAAVRQPLRIPGVTALQNTARNVVAPVWKTWPTLRSQASLLWEDAGETSEGDRDKLDRYLDGVLGSIHALAGGARPTPLELDGFGRAATRWAGRRLDPTLPAMKSGFRVVAGACEKCGACVRACPVDSIQTDPGGLPVFGQGCTGCWTCYNVCPHAAIAATGTPAGRGRYTGPSQAMRDLLG